VQIHGEDSLDEGRIHPEKDRTRSEAQSGNTKVPYLNGQIIRADEIVGPTTVMRRDE
jgi:hypothetical protein